MGTKHAKSPLGDVPGPGNYSPSYGTAKENTPSYRFGEKHRDLTNLDGPGPGAYNPDLEESKGYTIPERRMPRSTTDVPGPG